MSLCDGAGDDGLVPGWRSSVAALCEWTCLGRTAVIEALKGLQTAGAISIERSFGRVNKIRVLFEVAAEPSNQSATQTSPPDEPVRETDDHPSAIRTTPVRETDGTSPPAGPFTSLHLTPEEHLFDNKPAKQSKRSKNKTRLTDDFQPNDTGTRYASERSVNATTELQSFKNYHEAKGSTYLDWQAAWRTWCDNAVKFGRTRAPASTVRRTGYDKTNYTEGVNEHGSFV